MSGRRQRGAALLALLAVIVLGVAWALLAVVAPVNRLSLQRSRNATVLEQAKHALLGWAVTQAIESTESNPGRLPCPDTTGDGIAQSSCALPAVGWLPWRTLGLDELRDAAGERLWYIVSPGDSSTVGWARPTPGTDFLRINSNSVGNLTVDDQAHAAVALIVAPGAPIALVPTAAQVAMGCAARVQARNPAAPNYLDYLECQNIPGASLRTSVVDNAVNPVFNDQALIVTASDVLDAIEAPVAARIARDIVPQLQSVYASSVWGTSATNPAFPFPAAFGDPAASMFKGVASANPQGFLPLVASTNCSTGIASVRCDPNFHTWDTSTLSVTQTGGDATTFSANCGASSATAIRCTISFSKLLCILCSQVYVDVAVQARGSNVGLALRTLDASLASGMSACGSPPCFTAPLQTDGSALATYRGRITGTGGLLCGSLILVLCNGSSTVTIPITVFQDHPFLNPSPPASGAQDNAYWFLANNWHYVTYYAVAPLHTPGAAGNCTGATCISVNAPAGGTPITGSRAVLVLAGRNVLAVPRTYASLGQLLDTAENQNLDTTFEQNRVNKAFNDRFVSLSP